MIYHQVSTHRKTTGVLNVPGVGLAKGHLSSERAAGSVLVFGGQQGWRNLPPPQLHRVPRYPDLLKLLSAAAKTHHNPSKSDSWLKNSTGLLSVLKKGSLRRGEMSS